MKANKAPKKIYLDEDESWHLTNPNGNSVEYTRTDAFIEKACDYLMEYEFNNSPTITDRRKRVDKFINYMKGE